MCDGDQDSAQKSRAASPTYNSATMPEADSAAEPTPTTTQLAPLAFPRVHVFADGRIVAAGRASTGGAGSGTADFALVRYHP